MSGRMNSYQENSRSPLSSPERFTRILMACLERGLTGCLEVATRRESHRLFLRRGLLTHVEIQGGQEPLGMVLLEIGALTARELTRTLGSKKGDLYGNSLIRSGP